MSGPRIGSLFSGYGGIDLGLRELWPDARTVWTSDIKPGAIKVLEHRFPDAPNLGDITTIDWSTVEPVDIITGGSPCQDLSHAGKRAGMKPGTRSGLWASMCDAIETLRPSLVIWENVRGALSAEAITGDVESCGFCMADRDGQPMRALGRVLGDLADIGYDAAWVGLRAADVGACHGRFRVFVLAWPTNSTDIGRAWARTSWAGRNGLEDGSHDAVALLRSPCEQEDGGGPLHPDDAKVRGQTLRLTGQILAMTGDLLPTPAVNDMGKAYTPDEWDDWTAVQKAKHGNGNGHGKSLEIEAARLSLLPTTSVADSLGGHERRGGDRGEELLLNGIAKEMGRAVDSLEALHASVYAPAIRRHEQAFGALAPMPTEPTGRKGANRLSPAFTEWMMGLPDGWVTDVPGVTRTEALSMCGDGVVPQQCATAVRWLLDVRDNSTTPTLKETHK